MGSKLEKEAVAHVMPAGSGLVFVVRNLVGVSRQTLGSSSETGFWCFRGKDGGADLGPNRYYDFFSELLPYSFPVLPPFGAKTMVKR